MFVLHCEYLNDILIYYFCLNIHTPQICSKVLLFSQIGKSFLTNPHFFLILDIFPLSGKYISVNCLCVILAKKNALMVPANSAPYYAVQIVCHLQPFEGLSICNTIETAKSYMVGAFFLLFQKICVSLQSHWQD